MRNFGKFHKMLLHSFLKIIIILVTIFTETNCETTRCVINGKKLLNVLDDHFISFNLDFDSIRNSLTEQRLPSVAIAKHLYPALIRIPNFFTSDSVYPPVTQWEHLNSWFREANLIPIFLLYGELSYDHLSPYFEANFQNKFICYWELDASGGTTKENLTKNLKTLNKIWEQYPMLKKYLKVVGSDWKGLKETLKQYNYASDTIIQENSLRTHKGDSIWFAPPNQPSSNSLAWVKQLEESARAGFTTIFQKEAFEQLFSNTPIFWMSMLYKNLIGPDVLDVRSKPTNSTLHLYVHCSKIQVGALSLIAVNEGSDKSVVTLRIPLPHLKKLEVHSFILTFSEDTPNSQTYVNGKKVDFQSLPLKPHVESLRISNHALTLSLPGKSVGFFTVIGTRISACSKKDPSWTSLLPRPFNEVIVKVAHQATNLPNYNWSKTSETTTMRPTASAPPMVNVEVVYSDKSASDEESGKTTKIELELTKEEIRQILLNRAKAKAVEQNIRLTEEELQGEIMVNERSKRGINMELLREAAEERPYKRQHHRLNEDKHTARDYEEVDDRMEFMMGADLNKIDEKRPSYGHGHGHGQDKSLDLEDTISKISHNINKHKGKVNKYELESAVRKLEHFLSDANSKSEESEEYSRHSRRFKRDLFEKTPKKLQFDNDAPKKVPLPMGSEDNNSEAASFEEKKNTLEKSKNLGEKSLFKSFNLIPNLIQTFESLKSKRRDKRREHFEKILGFSKDSSSSEDYFNRRKRTEELKTKRNIEMNLRSMSSKLRRDEIKKRINNLNSWVSNKKVKRSVDLAENIIQDEGRVKGDFEEFTNFPQATTVPTLTSPLPIESKSREATTVPPSPLHSKSEASFFESVSNSIKSFFSNVYKKAASYFP